MKKIIAFVMVLALCVGVFAACKPNTDPTEPAASMLERAKKYVFLLYKDGNVQTPGSYDVVKNVTIDGVSFPIEWTIEIKSGVQDAVKVGPAGDALVTIEVSETVKEDTEYTLTATIKDADGKTAAVSFDRMIPKVITAEEVINAAYALKPGEAMEDVSKLTGTVTKINDPYAADFKNITVTIVCEGLEDYPIMCYRMKGEGADKVAVGDLITVTGIIKNYGGIIEFDAGCTLMKLEAGAGKLPEGGDTVDYSKMSPAEIVDAAYALKGGESFDSEVSLTGVVSVIDEPFSADYNNVTVIIIVESKTDKPIKCYRMKGEGADQVAVGDTITVTGIIKNYVHSSGDSEIEFDSGCKLDNRVPGAGSDTPDPTTGAEPTTPPATNPPAPPATNPPAPPATTKTDAEIVDAAYALAEGAAMDSPVTLTGTVVRVNSLYDANLGNITVTIAVAGREDKPIMCYRLKGTNAEKIGLKDVITVTGTIKNYKGTIEFDSGCTLDKFEDVDYTYPVTTPEEIVDSAYALAENDCLPVPVSLTGKIIEIKTAYNADFKNITVIIEVAGREGKPITCYRLKGDGADKLAVGDTITVSGSIKNFKGTIEFDSGCTFTK